jgi:hypothetical protein
VNGNQLRPKAQGHCASARRSPEVCPGYGGRHRLANIGLIPGGIDADRLTPRKHFFLKKEAKTFAYLRMRWGNANAL